jgi:hypothetical protein
MGMQDRWGRLASLTGVLFAAVVVAAFVSNSSESPEPNASATKVVSYFTSHRSEVEASSILFAVAFLVFVFFAGTLRSHLRRSASAEGLASLALAGSVLMAVGAGTLSGLEYGLAHELSHFSPTVAQTLSILDNLLFLPLLIGAFVFGVSAGLAILRGRQLPVWLGWVAIVLAIVAMVPPIGFAALVGFVLWSLVVSVLMYVRGGAGAERPAMASAG